jgi:DNA repair exonuclease SbcCD ATPase subunit
MGTNRNNPANYKKFNKMSKLDDLKTMKAGIEKKMKTDPQNAKWHSKELEAVNKEIEQLEKTLGTTGGGEKSEELKQLEATLAKKKAEAAEIQKKLEILETEELIEQAKAEALKVAAASSQKVDTKELEENLEEEEGVLEELEKMKKDGEDVDEAINETKTIIAELKSQIAAAKATKPAGAGTAPTQGVLVKTEGLTEDQKKQVRTIAEALGSIKGLFEDFMSSF